MKKKTLLLGALAFLLLGSILALPRSAAHAATAGCVFLSSPTSTPAFCDTFDAPAGTGNRSGDLNGTVWGVSRSTEYNNVSQGDVADWYAATLNLCGTTVTVSPEHDVRICDGHVAEAVNDGGSAQALAMYPKQPFDIAGRTGTVVFDMSNDTFGGHSAWPEFWYTDQPTPAPFSEFPSSNSMPRNGLGLRFWQKCTTPSGATGWTMGAYDVVTNYVDNGYNQMQGDACVVPGSAAANTMNHVELRISQSQVDIYATDAFPIGGTLPPLQHLGTVSGITLPISRGLVWLMDAHYNGDKDGGNQSDHTFYWDNVGFDGPALPQDRTFDVLDAQTDFTVDGNLGWDMPGDGTPVLSTLPVDSTSLANATGALLTFSYNTNYTIQPFAATVNGHAVSAPAPYDTSWAGDGTFAIPVPLADVVTGANQVAFTNGGQEAVIWNVDLVLIGGGGSGTALSTPNPTPTATLSPATPAPTSTPASTPLNNAPCTVTLNGTATSGVCNGTFTPA